VSTLNDYIVPIAGTKDGLHQYDYEIDASFLKQFNYSDVLDIHAHIHVSLYKSNRLFDISISMKGDTLVECDRCLDNFSMPVAFNHHLIIKVEDNVADDDEDVIFMPESSTEIDLAPYVFETVVFSIPMRKVHPVDLQGHSQCNQEMISKLNQYLINESPTDPRWDALKELLN